MYPLNASPHPFYNESQIERENGEFLMTFDTSREKGDGASGLKLAKDGHVSEDIEKLKSLILVLIKPT